MIYKITLSAHYANLLGTNDTVHYFDSGDALKLFVTSMDEIIGEETKWKFEKVELKTFESVQRDLRIVNNQIDSQCN